MLSLILLIFALVLFIIAGWGPAGSPEWPWRNRLVCFGLACWVASELVARGPGLLKG